MGTVGLIDKFVCVFEKKTFIVFCGFFLSLLYEILLLILSLLYKITLSFNFPRYQPFSVFYSHCVFNLCRAVSKESIP